MVFHSDSHLAIWRGLNNDKHDNTKSSSKAIALNSEIEEEVVTIFDFAIKQTTSIYEHFKLS